MTVRLPHEHKTHIAHLYAHENASSEDIARQYTVSQRTVQRVLLEMGVARTPKRTEKITTPVIEQPAQLELPIEMYPELTWYERSIGVLKRTINKLSQSYDRFAK
jgi:transposase-like protein